MTASRTQALLLAALPGLMLAACRLFQASPSHGGIPTNDYAFVVRNLPGPDRFLKREE